MTGIMVKPHVDDLKAENISCIEAEIIRAIQKSGPMPFADFMAAALYSPRGGYYTSPEGRWGAEGDYITSIDVSPVFSKLLAVQIHEMWALCGSPAAFELIEAGAGRGGLSKGILSTLKAYSRPLYDIIKVRIIEKNRFLRDGTQEKITWHDDFQELQSPACACVLSNELIDSFPVHRVKWSNGRLQEIYVDYLDGRFVELLKGPSTEALAAYIKESGTEPVDGMIMEINLNAGRWLETVSAFLTKGFVITIDYGMPAKELYAPERRAGTLMCSYKHTVNEDPYKNVGNQDMTTHVDFTMFKNRGSALGLELTGYTTQKNFFMGLGIIEELKEAGATGNLVEDYDKIQHNRALARLINPGGMGDTFKVMVQHKGLEKPCLKGFSFKDLSRRL